MLYARETKTSHENFEARCPACDTWLVYNRASDLDGATKIDFRRVTCTSCTTEFAINGDNADATYAVLLIDVFDLIAQRQYARAILTIAQSYEAFFLHTLCELLALKLLVKHRHTTRLDAANDLLRDLHTITATWTYRPMRNAFINLALNGAPQTIGEARGFLTCLPLLTADPADETLNAHHDAHLADLLLQLKRATIDELRNQVAHKHAYRPTAAQTTDAFNEARSLIWPLAQHLDVRFDSC